MKNVGIVGISGYSGGELLSLLLNHPQARVNYVSANNTIGAVNAIWPHLKGRTRLNCEKYSLSRVPESCEIVFLAVPHTIAMHIAPGLLKAKKKVIDLSADYRLNSAPQFKKWYNAPHRDKKNLARAVYGLPEIYREDIKKADLVANPGCYPTAALLALAPLVSTRGKTILSVIIDAKSGVSGAGRKAVLRMSFCEVNENLRAYKVFEHQHVPEIEDHLSSLADRDIAVAFVPHLVPTQRGILETIYIRSKTVLEEKKLVSLYRKFYKREPFVRILEGQQPELKNVNHTNYCDIAIKVGEGKNLTVITAAIDNLRKGAAGQAVQNMNIMCGFPEQSGLH